MEHLKDAATTITA